MAAAQKGVAPWENPDGTASDVTFARRAWLDFAGRPPTRDEAERFAAAPGPAPAQRARLVEDLLASDDFVDYWTMRFCDVLRVKSEFPVNLWPNAVYVYHRRIRAFVAADEPWDVFARALLTATGSDFRVAEANFTRATAVKTPAGFAEAAVRTFLNEEISDWPAAERARAEACFAGVRIKTTREWKEEIVLADFPDGRAAFCDWLLGEGRTRFARGFVRRVAEWIFTRPDAPDEWVRVFEEGGFRLRPLLRAIASSAAYGAGPVTGGFPLRRLDAEVLDDVFCALGNERRRYSSIAPEPFTFIPGDRRTVALEDGSITSGFLLLFGRPARDDGRLSERDNAISDKQRLHLFNSGDLHRKLERATTRDPRFRALTRSEQIADLYWRILSRPPTEKERAAIDAAWRKLRGREAGNFPVDLAWALVNGREFLYRH